MYKRSITYTNFDGEKVTKDHHFNLTKAEVIEMQLSAEDGLDKKIQRMSGTGDNGYIVSTLKDMILKSYGKMTEDGFIKSKEISAAFASSEAYSEFFMELIQNPEEQKAFFTGIMPKEVSATIKEQFDKVINEQPKISAV